MAQCSLKNLGSRDDNMYLRNKPDREQGIRNKAQCSPTQVYVQTCCFAEDHLFIRNG